MDTVCARPKNLSGILTWNPKWKTDIKNSKHAMADTFCIWFEKDIDFLTLSIYSAVEGDSGEQDQSSKTGTEGSAYQAAPNPFGVRPILRKDIVSSASTYGSSNVVHIAPSRLGTTVKTTQANTLETKKPSILAPSRLGILNKSESSPSKCLLRPSALAQQVQNLKQKDLELKEKENVDGQEDDNSVNKLSEESDSSSLNLMKNTDDKPKSSHENYFATAISSTKTQSIPDKPSDAGGGSNDFVFGQNLNERVTGIGNADTKSKKSEGGFVFGQNLEERAIVSEDQTENNDKDDKDEKEEETNNHTTPEKTLEESAREYQEQHEKKVDIKEIEVKTGEEEESNVLQATCKLYLFDSNVQNWIERGRGLLRLNDYKTSNPGEFQSRLVMRTQGSLRLILNTKIFPGMTIERASQKSIRLTATDMSDGIKVFLISTSPKDSDNILRAVDWRIQQLRIKEEWSEKPKVVEKRKVDTDESSQESPPKKLRSTEDNTSVPTLRRTEESDGSVVDPETDASSSSCCTSSSLTLRSESD
ncbi:hypothetical protein FSP39_021353 [Pinctada imbricata]|uniref:RanBD1 domain-containing protein n=1 Tax=Pinctada imbricata TaxID=66713 RepID=A0AA89BUS2_PINIB|nr:hypothetical protein FSP39_021353 [Pinctada imbricata]